MAPNSISMKRDAFFVVGFLLLQFGVLNAATPYWWGSTLTPNYNDNDKVTQQKNNQLLSDILSNGIPVTGLGFTGTVTMASSIGLANTNNLAVYSLTLSNQLETLNAYIAALSNILVSATAANVNITNSPTVIQSNSERSITNRINIDPTNTLASAGNANVTNIVNVTANNTNAPAVQLSVTPFSLSIDTATASYQITNTTPIRLICIQNTNTSTIYIRFASNGAYGKKVNSDDEGQWDAPANTALVASNIWLSGSTGTVNGVLIY